MDRLGALQVWFRDADGRYTAAKLERRSVGDYAWLGAAAPEGTTTVEADGAYGVFRRGEKAIRLHYFAKGYPRHASAPSTPSEKLALDLLPRVEGGALRLRAVWRGEPAAGLQVVVTSPDGEATELESDAAGEAGLEAVQPGYYELRVRRIDETAGEASGEVYDEVRHYTTVTWHSSVPDENSAPVVPAVTTPATDGRPAFPDLPVGITSFGAAVLDDALYVYGGHTGRAHEYSSATQSGALRRLALTGGADRQWQVVGEGVRLQGLALVAHGAALYRIGGFTAHNAEGDEHDLRSVATVSRFDVRDSSWTDIAPLPEPRSSHDAVILGDRLYVVGGWALGADEPVWHDTAWSMDLSRADAAWEAVPAPGFRRRALALGHLAGRVYVVGGMTPDNAPTTRVDVFDPQAGRWSEGPAIDGTGMEGFGASAWTLGDRLFVTTHRGRLHCLESGSAEWTIPKTLEEGRFFHRMVPFRGELILVGGSSRGGDKRLRLEAIAPSEPD